MPIASVSRALLPFLLLPAALIAQKKTAGVVIAVDDVKPATAAYNQFNGTNVLQQHTYKTVMVSSDQQQQLVPTLDNSFLGTIHLAYAQHHDLVLSPDDIWIQIALGVSIHIDHNYAQLNKLVVTSPEKERLAVRIDALAEMGSPAWQQLIDTFAVMAQNKVQPDFYKTMLPEFSTSTPETRTVLNAILLSSVRKGLEMHGASGCGIPNVVLTGTKADWEKLLMHVGELEKYDLKFWTDELKPILREFVNAFDGKANRQFWQQIYKYREGYMIRQMNGWSSKFFPYFVEPQWIDDSVRIAAFVAENPGAENSEGYVETLYYPNPYLKGDDYLFHAIDLRNLPSSECTVPFTWSNLFSDKPEDQEQQLYLHAGFCGASQHPKTLALQNNPSWFIVQQHDYLDIDWDTMGFSGVHPSDFVDGFWYEKPVDGPAVNAVYHPEKNKTTEQGLEELKAELRRHLKKAGLIDDLSGAKMQFVVTHFGSVSRVVFIKPAKLSEMAMITLDLKLKKLNYAFQPTTVTMDTLSKEMYFEEELRLQVKGAVKANSIITLTF